MGEGGIVEGDDVGILVIGAGVIGANVTGTGVTGDGVIGARVTGGALYSFPPPHQQHASFGVPIPPSKEPP